jgi:hypothetical protein
MSRLCHLGIDTNKKKLNEATLEELHQLVQSHFGSFAGTPLPDHVRMILEEQVGRCREQTLARIQWMLSLEYPPFTENEHYFSSYREKYLAQYRATRQVK